MTEQQETATETTEIVKFDYQGRALVKSRTDMKAMLRYFERKLVEALPPGAGLTIGALIESAIFAATQNSKILQCTQESVLQSIVKAARLALDCGGTLGSAYLVPFKETCQLIIGYRGFLDLARRAAKTADIDCQLVYEGDEISIVQGTTRELVHKPSLTAERTKDKIMAAYMVTTYADAAGTQKFELMTRKEIDRIRNRSRAANKGPWVTDFGEMARKTVLRRGIKYVPISVAEAGRVLAEAIEHDNRTFGLVDGGEPEDSPEQLTANVARQLGRERDDTIDIEPVAGHSEPLEEPETLAQPPGLSIGRAGQVELSFNAVMRDAGYRSQAEKAWPRFVRLEAGKDVREVSDAEWDKLDAIIRSNLKPEAYIDHPASETAGEESPSE